jgi:NAD(P)-dependent dehydrogenase (short-subunit alcohol dehydrogenase family)
MSISFEGKVAIVTGAGNGLGRSHALALAERGAKVVVNEAAGGEAFAHGANVSNFDEVENMVAQAMAKWGRVDILINNAGILRDKSFSKMDLADFKLVMDVHLMGSVNCTKAVWDIMRAQNYGRIVMTTSSSGMYGNFGQTNYGAAKMAVLGFMNTLVLEGAKNNIHVNALAPTAGTRMTEDLMPPEMLGLLTAESVTAAALVLCDEGAPTRTILCAGAGGYAKAGMYETDGIFLAQAEQNPEAIVAQWDELSDPSNQQPLESGGKQTEKFLMKAMAALQA